MFQSINHDKIKYQGPLILRMYGALNKLNMRNENRYILCNFIDQNDFHDNIYEDNDEYSLNQLFLYAFNKAQQKNIIGSLYEEYINSINAICEKHDIHE